MKGIILFIVVIVLLLTAIVVGARNNEIVTINYLLAQIDMRVSVLMAVCIALGIFVGISTILTKYFALKLRFATMKRRVDKLSIEKSE
jgi:putative membrane protein